MTRPSARHAVPLIALVAVALLALAGVAHADLGDTAAPAPMAPLTLTAARFVPGPGVAPPAAGEPVTLPHRWQATHPALAGEAWYVLEFDAGGTPAAIDGLYLSAMRVAAEVEVNGERVARIGRIGAHVPRSYEQAQLVHVPAGLLHPGSNRIVLHAWTPVAGDGGVGPILAGPYAALRGRARLDLFVHTLAPAAVSLATFTVGAFILLLWLRQRREPSYALFGVAAMLWSVHTLVSLWPGMPLPPAHWRILWHSVYVVFVALLCLFCVNFAHVRWRGYRRFVIAYAALVPPVLYASYALHVLDYVAPAIRVGCLTIVLIGLGAIGRYAWRTRSAESGLLFATGLISAVFAVHDATASQMMVRPVWLVPYAALAFLMLVAWILTDRFTRALESAERLNVELEQRVDEKSAALRAQLAVTQDARDAALTANRAKSSFLAAASHDLRQPLHALGMFSQALSEHVHDADARLLVQRINTSVAALETLFSALLDVSRLDAGVVIAEPRAVHVRPLLERLADELMPEALERGLRLAVMAPDAVVHSDPVLLERILRNLLANALRYTHQGGVVLACRRRGAGWSLEVWDSGPGIAAHERARIFEEFYQVTQPGRERGGGLGLGLAIVRRLAQLLGHAVRVDSRVGRGSVFRLAVPGGDARATAAPSYDDSAATPLAGAHVLVVDDAREVRDGVARLLAQWGCGVTALPDGETACACCAAGLRPDALLVDYRLGAGMDGLATIAALRDVLGAAIPAVLVSGESEAAELARITASGVTLLHKPLPPARLRSVLAHLLAQAPRGEALTR